MKKQLATFLNLLRTNRRILAISGLCLFMCAGFVEIIEHLWLSGHLFSGNLAIGILLLGLLLLIPVSLFYAIFHVIHRTLTGASRNLQLGSVLLSYAAVIVVFSGYFYFQCSLADLEEAESEYRYYEKLRTYATQDSLKVYGEELRRKVSLRAFQGITPRLWRGIHDSVPGWPADAGLPPVSKLVDAGRRPLSDVVSFNHQAKVPVFLDCLYFSTVAITSTGFGDITPSRQFVKLLVAVESISGVVLVAIGIAIALGRLGSDKAPVNDEVRQEDG